MDPQSGGNHQNFSSVPRSDGWGQTFSSQPAYYPQQAMQHQQQPHMQYQNQAPMQNYQYPHPFPSPAPAAPQQNVATAPFHVNSYVPGRTQLQLYPDANGEQGLPPATSVPAGPAAPTYPAPLSQYAQQLVDQQRHTFVPGPVPDYYQPPASGYPNVSQNVYPTLPRPNATHPYPYSPAPAAPQSNVTIRPIPMSTGEIPQQVPAPAPQEDGPAVPGRSQLLVSDWFREGWDFVQKHWGLILASQLLWGLFVMALILPPAVVIGVNCAGALSRGWPAPPHPPPGVMMHGNHMGPHGHMGHTGAHGHMDHAGRHSRFFGEPKHGLPQAEPGMAPRVGAAGANWAPQAQSAQGEPRMEPYCGPVAEAAVSPRAAEGTVHVSGSTDVYTNADGSTTTMSVTNYGPVDGDGMSLESDMMPPPDYYMRHTIGALQRCMDWQTVVVANFVIIFLALFISGPARASLYIPVFEKMRGTEVRIAHFFHGLRFWGRLFAEEVTVMFVTWLGYQLLWLPGLYLRIALSFTIPLIVEHKLGVFDALARSLKRVHADFWLVVRLYLGMFLLIITVIIGATTAAVLSAIPVGVLLGNVDDSVATAVVIFWAIVGSGAAWVAIQVCGCAKSYAFRDMFGVTGANAYLRVDQQSEPMQLIDA